jgi:hypothetical protein
LRFFAAAFRSFIHQPLACLTVIAFAFSLPFVYDATRPALHLSNGDVTTLSLDRSRAAAPLLVTLSRGQRPLCHEPLTAKGLSGSGSARRSSIFQIVINISFERAAVRSRSRHGKRRNL